ncbi:MAG: hypothetical protein M1833_003372 [Piccolia ochrophora]|nr:MAG: hypothetical protein M1833_003372 [Piccolia ochrophora]
MATHKENISPCKRAPSKLAEKRPNVPRAVMEGAIDKHPVKRRRCGDPAAAKGQVHFPDDVTDTSPTESPSLHGTKRKRRPSAAALSATIQTLTDERDFYKTKYHQLRDAISGIDKPNRLLGHLAPLYDNASRLVTTTNSVIAAIHEVVERFERGDDDVSARPRTTGVPCAATSTAPLSKTPNRPPTPSPVSKASMSSSPATSSPSIVPGSSPPLTPSLLPPLPPSSRFSESTSPVEAVCSRESTPLSGSDQTDPEGVPLVAKPKQRLAIEEALEDYERIQKGESVRGIMEEEAEEEEEGSDESVEEGLGAEAARVV